MSYMNLLHVRVVRGKRMISTSTNTNKSCDGSVEFKHVTLRYMTVIKVKRENSKVKKKLQSTLTICFCR